MPAGSQVLSSQLPMGSTVSSHNSVQTSKLQGERLKSQNRGLSQPKDALETFKGRESGPISPDGDVRSLL